LNKSLIFRLTDAANFAQDAGAARPAAEQGADVSRSANSGFPIGRLAGVEGRDGVFEIGINGDGRSVGKIGKRPPCIGRRESIVEEARVDQGSFQTGDAETAFRLAVPIVFLIVY
jgi:hypothetical protein